jgi:hypothetical protein
MGCQIAVALAVLRAVRLSCDRARFLTDHLYDYDQTQSTDAERSTGIAILANPSPRCAEALRGSGSPCHSLHGTQRQPEGEDQFALEGEDPAMRSTRSAYRACREGRVEAQTLTFEGESGACANSSREMAVLGERGRTREPGLRRMSARKNRRVICQTESPAKGTSGQLKAPTFGLHRGERPHSGFTPPDCVPHLFPRGVGPGFSFQRSSSKRRACASRFSAGIRSSGRSKAVVSLLAEVVAHGGFAVLLHGHGWRAWYRSRRIRSYYALHSSSKRTDLAASCVSMPGGDRDDGPSRTVVVLGHCSGCGTGCIQVGGHHSGRFRAVAWIEQRVVTGQEHGRLAVGCSGKPLAAFASPAIPHMCIASTGSVSGHSPRPKGTVESALGWCARARECPEAASRRSAGGCPTFFRRGKGCMILFGDFSEGKTVTPPTCGGPRSAFGQGGSGRQRKPAARTALWRTNDRQT